MAQDLNDHEMIQFIVEQVNQVLSRSHSLVEFDELAPTQLLQVLANIFEQLSPKAAVDFNSEPQQPGCMRLLEFLCRTLGYKVPPMIQQTFSADFMNAEKTVMYPVLYWVLKRMPENRKRVYLAEYLAPIDIPEDLRMQDDGIRELYTRYQQLRSDFIDVHKRVDALKEASADPTEAKRKIAIQEGERDQLAQLINTGQKKLQGIPNKDSLIQACRTLKTEQDENQKLRLKRDEQNHALMSSQRRVTELTNRLRDVKRDIQENRMEAVVQRISDDLHANRMRVEQELPQELNEKRAQIAALSKLMNDPLDLGALHSEMAGLDKECAALQQQVAERNKPADDGTNIVMVKQQVTRVVKKKQEIQQQLQTVQAEAMGLQDQIRDREGQLDQLRSSKILKGDDFKRYSNQVRSKVAATKTMKQRLQDLRGEFGVLQYTEKLLRSKHEELQGDLSEIEKRVGALGFTDAAEALTKVSDEKNTVEQLKGSTLDELSVVVQDLVKTISDRRTKLAPQILELREARSSAQVVESEWVEKKSAYEYQQGMLMQEVNKLEADVRNLSDETRLSESLFHRLQCQMTAADIHRQRAERERGYRANNGSLDSLPEFRGRVLAKKYTELFLSMTEDLERRSKEMQRKRRDIEENHEFRLTQVEAFTNLKKLLESKLQSIQTTGEAPQGVSLERDIQNIMGGTNARDGVNMLVLGSNN